MCNAIDSSRNLVESFDESLAKTFLLTWARSRQKDQNFEKLRNYIDSWCWHFCVIVVFPEYPQIDSELQKLFGGFDFF